MEDDLFQAFGSTSSEPTSGDEVGSTELDGLRKENALLREKLRSVAAGFGQVVAASQPLCCIGFYDTLQSQAFRTKAMRVLMDMAEEWSKNAGGEDINKPDERLVRAIVDQVQYYLSADNLDTDGFLNELLVVNDGALAIPRLMGFRKMVQLTSNREWVVAALKRAPLVELCHGDGAVRAVRRYTAQEARETALLPEEIPAKLEDQDHALLQLHEAAVICAGFGGVIDVKGTSMALDVPLYEMATDIPLPHAHHTGQKMRMDKRCFNCGLQDHMLTECPEPRDNGRITANRNAHALVSGNTGVRMDVRYHDETKMDRRKEFAHLRPGVMTSELRAALGLQDTEPAPWIERMWQHGYPPGYVEGARDAGDEGDIESGITIYDADGNIVADTIKKTGTGGSTICDGPPGRQMVVYEGYNAPPQPGIIIADPRNPYSSNYNPHHDTVRNMQVQSAHARAAVLENFKSEGRGMKRVAEADDGYGAHTYKRPHMDIPFMPLPPWGHYPYGGPGLAYGQHMNVHANGRFFPRFPTPAATGAVNRSANSTVVREGDMEFSSGDEPEDGQIIP